jgi:hypothetical protein
MSFLPSIYARSSFWTTSARILFPSHWHDDDGRSDRTGMGPATCLARARTILSYPLHRQLSLGSSLVGWGLFSLFIFGVVRLKNRLTGMRNAGSWGYGGIARPGPICWVDDLFSQRPSKSRKSGRALSDPFVCHK